jgi:hypothetical protein
MVKALRHIVDLEPEKEIMAAYDSKGEKMVDYFLEYYQNLNDFPMILNSVALAFKQRRSSDHSEDLYSRYGYLIDMV